MMDFVGTLLVSTKGNCGHSRKCTRNRGSKTEEAVANESGETSDCGRDAAAGSLGLESVTPTRCHRQPGVSMAEAIPRGAIGSDNRLPAGDGREGTVPGSRQAGRPHS